MKFIDVITSRLLLIFPEISGKFPEILNFQKIYNPAWCTAHHALADTHGTGTAANSACH